MEYEDIQCTILNTVMHTSRCMEYEDIHCTILNTVTLRLFEVQDLVIDL